MSYRCGTCGHEWHTEEGDRCPVCNSADISTFEPETVEAAEQRLGVEQDIEVELEENDLETEDTSEWDEPSDEEEYDENV